MLHFPPGQGFSMYSLAALLPCLVMMLVMPVVLFYLYPPEIKETPAARTMARAELDKLGPMQTPEIVTLGVLVLMLAVWAGVPAWLLGPGALLALWTVTSATGILDPRILSEPWTVVATAGELIADGRLLGVLDLDSPEPARFDAEDAAGCEALAALLADRLG